MVKAGKRVGLTVKVRAGFDPKSGGGGSWIRRRSQTSSWLRTG